MSERGESAEPRPEPDPARPGAPAGAAREAAQADAGGQAGVTDDGSTDDGSTDDGSTAALAAAEATAGRIAELEDQRLRALADLDNLRKRCASQVSEARAQARADVARQWLPVVDNLDRALAHTQADPSSIIDGIRAVRDQAVSVLAGLGFPRRNDLGTRFDPARHEAVAARTDAAAPDGSVVEVIVPGYGDGAGQLRPAQVVVAKAD
jgi:molecular chaperone GrpE